MGSLFGGSPKQQAAPAQTEDQAAREKRLAALRNKRFGRGNTILTSSRGLGDPAQVSRTAAGGLTSLRKLGGDTLA